MYLINNKNDDECSADVREKFDNNVAKLMSLGPNGRHWPETEPEHDDYCAETKRLNQHLDDYKTTCSSGPSKEFASIILFSLRRVTRQYCRKTAANKRKHTKLFAMYTCSNQLSNQTGECLEKYIDSLLSTVKLSTIEQKIPYTCCNYFELLKCTDDVFHSEVKCADSSETFQEFVRTIFDDIINVACGDYVEFSDKCQQLPILSLPVQRKNQKRPKSILIPLIEIWDQSASTKTN
ncbi:hypothetical protein HUG17_2636 [Dermatophagoides farinae]|uniref:DUF19 domain-containing protein n=1 Tax=Dermatophagoides farinae TaxID=6954 RepID=A0A9D4SED5_DERFA|nr:hypothetical protein HUG17_2636 [Dermatophagoides farinae]